MTAILPGLIDRSTARQAGSVVQELIVDNFAGAGGASLGIEAALGRCVDIAVNHNPRAVALHEINHPHTRHLCEDVWDVDPLTATAGRPVGLAWFSPDCKHFSKAKGGKPLSKRIRGLAWVVIRWAREAAPRVIILENVEEFVTWGPLDAAGKPIAQKKGQTFLRWKAMLRNLGYVVEHRELVAADYGVPTTRKRFFLIARRDGRPIVWPQRTHAPRTKAAGLGLLPWKSAAECIDWRLPCPSIFDRKKPLAEATLRRIARGIVKYVLQAKEPFIVQTSHTKSTGRGPAVWSPGEPLRTITSRNENGVVVPSITKFRTGATGSEMSSPVPTITAGGGNPDRPAGAGHALGMVNAFLSKYHGPRPGEQDGRSSSPAEPVRTVDTQNRFGVVGASLVHCAHGEESASGKRWGTGEVDPAQPVPTLTASKDLAIVSAALVGVGGRAGQSPERSAFDPVATMTAKGDKAVAAAHLTKLYGTSRSGTSAEGPMPTITGDGQHIGEVRAFLVKYYGSGGQDQACDKPMHTLTAKARLGLVSVAGEEYQITDIGLRMLQPSELLRAQFGRFASEYVLTGTKADQVAAIGNSVCPELAEAIVRANFQ